MTFTEASTVEKMILDAVTRLGGRQAAMLREDSPGWGDSLGAALRPACWTYVPAAQVPRKPGDVMAEPWVRKALLKYKLHTDQELFDRAYAYIRQYY